MALVAAYLLVTGVVLAFGGHPALAATHALLVCVTALTVVPKGKVSRTAGDVLPLLVMPALYAELPALIGVLGAMYHDAWVQHLELAMFGTQPSRALAQAAPYAWLSEVLHAGYLAYYPLIFAPPLLLLFRGERHAYSHTVLALTVTYVVCWAAFVLFPVQGPRFLWGPAQAPDYPIRRLVTAILATGSSRGAAFPSSHMAVSVTQAVLASRWQPRVAYGAWIVSGLVGLGAVYGGFHYAADILAGAALGLLVGGTCLLAGRSR